MEEKDNSTIPDEFKLCQNYPNPCNPETTIEFWIKEFSRVILKVYDLLGQEIANSINEQYNSGTYQIKFHAYKLSSGIYFYRIQTGNYQAVRKMELLEIDLYSVRIKIS